MYFSGETAKRSTSKMLIYCWQIQTQGINMKHIHSHGWGQCPAHAPLSHVLAIEVTASEHFCLKSVGGEGCMDTCSVTSIILQSPDSQISFLDYFCKTFKLSFLVLLGSFSTIEPPVIMQFDFYPWMFDFIFHHL